ncbi:MAG: hypothetical protein E3J72_20425 [Planctomycetota bacterium]|nr:MAG: hypothetical protein E3J72_20425 [Planctomycetota bacterium]
MKPEIEQTLKDLSIATQQMFEWRPLRNRYPLLFEGAKKQVRELQHRLELLRIIDHSYGAA